MSAMTDITHRNRRVPAGTPADPSLRSSLGAWQAAVVLLPLVDPITTELVRLRCAKHHDCGT